MNGIRKINLFQFKTQLKLLNEANRLLATSWNPKWRELRRKKVVKPELPDYEKIFKEAEATGEERRSYAIKSGVEAPISFEYKPMNLTASGEVFDPYVPPEGDGKATIITKDGLNQLYSKLKSKGTIWRHIRKIQQYEDAFDPMEFSEQAQGIFINAHEALQNRDSERLIEFVTETCYPKMWANNRYKTIRWKWIEAIEPPRVVHILTREMLSKANIFGQATVRMHSKQTLAVYDRFGRLAYGNEQLPKNVLEYLVFEKNLTNRYSTWRLHDKIVPTWAEEKMPIKNTYRQVKLYKTDKQIEVKSKFKNDESHLNDIEATAKAA